MKTKEVEKAINQLIVDINFSETGCSTGIIDVKNIETVLNYISELEEKCKSEFKRGVNVKFAEEFKGAKKLTIPTQYIDKQVIRDKIKELDNIIYYAGTEEGMMELKDYEYDKAKYGIEVLKEILGEQI